MRGVIVGVAIALGLTTVALSAPSATLDAKFKSSLRKGLASNRDAQRLLEPETCTLTSGSSYRCYKRGCAGHACQVLEASADVTLKGKAVKVRNVTVKNLGDTGQCGCCMGFGGF